MRQGERRVVMERSRSGAQRGPNAGGVAIVHVALFAASLIVMAIVSGSHIPSPFDAPEPARRFFLDNAAALQFVALLQFGSAVPLGIFTATVVARLRYLGFTVPGSFIALFGGFGAAIFIAISALAQWVLAQPGIAADLPTMRALQLFSFATGGVGYVVMFGLLMAGVSIPSLVGRLLPRWLAWGGLVVAALAELSTFSLVAYPATFLLPIARFAGLLWLIAAGFMLPRSRDEARGKRGRGEER